MINCSSFTLAPENSGPSNPWNSQPDQVVGGIRVAKRLTVKELKAALVDVPDELEVHFGSDTEEAYEIVIEMARRVKYDLPDGKRFEDTGETGVDYFEIYGNAVQDEDDP